MEELYPYLILDARYEKMREDGAARSQVVLVANGINWDGRNILAAELASREITFAGRNCWSPAPSLGTHRRSRTTDPDPIAELDKHNSTRKRPELTY